MRRGTLGVGAVLLLGAAAACASPATTPLPSPTPAPSAAAGLTTGTVRVGDSACATDLPQSLPAGPTEIIVANESQGERHIGIWRIGDEFTFDDVTFHVENELQRAEGDEPSEGHPSFLSEGAGVSVEGGGSVPLQHVTRAGTYVILCVRTEGAEQRLFQALGPIQVD